MELIVSDIEILVEEDIDIDLKEILNAFLAAINDWPDEALTLDSYASQVEDFMKGPSTKANLEKGSVFHGNDAWKCESIAGVMEVYKYYDEATSLFVIIEDVKAKLDH